MLRLGGRMAALIVLLLDVLKGMAPVYLAWYLQIKPVYLYRVAACLGHMYPPSSTSVAAGRHRPRYHAAHRLCHGGAVITTWLLVLLVSGYSSLASIVTVLLTPPFYLSAQTGIHVAGLPALPSHPDPSSREHYPPAQGEESRLWGRRGAVLPAEVMKMDDAAQKKRRTRRKVKFPVDHLP